MSGTRSFRWRLLVGALFAGFGMFTIAPLVSLLFLAQHRVTLHLLHIIAMAAFGTAFLLVGVWQVRRGLVPFDELRDRLADVKDGRASRLVGRYPSEVQPLANELNAFLEDREQVVKKAIAKAADLAHGLKTPLAIVSREAERAAAAGHDELAATLMQQVERMKRQIEYHLAHARAAGSASNSRARTPIRQSVDGLVRALQRLHAERDLRFEVNLPESIEARVEREDLDEMLGNLLDNACKWAASQVVVSSSSAEGSVAILIEDDGKGIPVSMREAVLQRGVRADEAAPGSGLGLAIVRELAEIYGGSVMLDESESGGLRARLVLPMW